MSSNSISNATNVDRLVQQMVGRVDKNGDGQISNAEFGSFLSSMLENLSKTTLPTNGPNANAIVATAAGAPPVERAAMPPLNPISGFSLAKLQDLTHVTDKYSGAARAFSRAIGGLEPKTASLASVVTFAQASGFPSAKVTGSDTIDFGDGRGPIDVIIDVDGPGATWAFQNW